MTTSNDTYVAVDLGSNSFHMIVADIVDDRIKIIDKIKDSVRLAAGLDEDQNISQKSMEKALVCLERFGQIIKNLPRNNVRAVGTNTLRRARNSSTFLKLANSALGHQIEIISGREEARLIYLGVANSVYDETNKRLVVDIGGGSTEVVIGQGYHAQYTESLYMGCVSMSERYFSGKEVTAKKMRKAIISARQELATIETLYKRVGWDSAIGSSGTILTIQKIIKEKGWGDALITNESLEKLRNELIKVENIDLFESESLSALRKQVIAGGVAILSAIFEALKIEQMDISDGALREGLLHDLIGRMHDRDIRDQTVTDLMERYGVDKEHANQVKNTVGFCFQQLHQILNLDPVTDLKLLKWAASLHEIGLRVAHSQYHKHGAYLLNNSELPGFSKQEQSRLAMLVRCHRRKFPLEEMQYLNFEGSNNLLILIIIFRLAVVLNRDRTISSLPEFVLGYKDDRFKIVFPDNWLDGHPLTFADLETEANYFSVLKYKLEFK